MMETTRFQEQISEQLPGIELRFFEDKQLSEIAEILGENLSTIKSRLYRGLRKLRIQLAVEES